MSHYSSSSRTYMKSRSIVTIWTHEAHIISWMIVCCPCSALHALQERGWTWLYQVVGVKKAHRSRWSCCYVEPASCGHLFIYLAGLFFFPNPIFLFIDWFMSKCIGTRTLYRIRNILSMRQLSHILMQYGL